MCRSRGSAPFPRKRAPTGRRPYRVSGGGRSMGDADDRAWKTNGAASKIESCPNKCIVLPAACRVLPAYSTSRSGFSRYPFTACRKRATSAPSEMRWSAERVIFILYATAIFAILDDRDLARSSRSPGSRPAAD